MNTLRLKLMHREAVKRLADAALLVEADPLGSRRYDSDQLLKLLGLELLLKFIFEIEIDGKANEYKHDYCAIFNALPSETQSRLLDLCGERIGPSALATEHCEVLKEWSANFVAIRYPFERYKGMSEVQYKAMSERWVQKGAKLENATFRFYPQELMGMLHALQIIANLHAELHFGAEFVHDRFCA